MSEAHAATPACRPQPSFLMTGTAYSPVAAGSPGPLDRKTPSGAIARMSSGNWCAGAEVHDRHLAAKTGDQPQDVALDAVVDGHDVHRRLVLRASNTLVPDPGGFRPDRRLARTGRLREVETFQTRPGARLCLQRLDVEATVGRMRNDCVGHAGFANVGGQSTRIDALIATMLRCFSHASRCEPEHGNRTDW